MPNKPLKGRYLTVRLTEELYNRVLVEAERSERSLNGVCVYVLKTALDAKPPPDQRPGT